MIKTDKFKGDGENTVFRTSNAYEEGSITVSFKTTTEYRDDIPFTELGESFLTVNELPTKDTDVYIKYSIKDDVKGNDKIEASLVQRVAELEKIVIELHKSNIVLRESLNNRISVSTFQAWTKLMEKKTGITLVDSNLGYVGSELFKYKG